MNRKYYRLGKEVSHGEFEAIICVYNKMDTEGVTVRYGAFAKSAEKLRNGEKIPIRYEHNQEEDIGEIISISELPNGSVLLPEEAREYGACIALAKIDLTTELGKEVYKEVKSKQMKHLSVGFIPSVVTYGHDGSPSEFVECDLFEVSIVGQPMHEQAKMLVVYSKHGNNNNDNNQHVHDNHKYNNYRTGKAMKDEKSLIAPSEYVQQGTPVVYTQGAGRSTKISQYYTSDREAMAVGSWIRAKNTVDTERQKEFLQQYYSLSQYKEKTYSLTPSIAHQGGYLIPMGMLKAIESVRRTYGVARRYSNVQLMKELTEPLVDVDIDEVVMTPMDVDDATIPASKITLTGINLIAQWQKGKILYKDAQKEYEIIKLADAFAEGFGLAQAKLEDDYVFRANGEQTYYGAYGVGQKCLTQLPLADIATNPAVTSVANWGAITWEVLNPVINHWVSKSIKPTIFCSQEFWTNVLVDVLLSVSNITTGDLYNAPKRQFFGIDVEFVEGMPRTTTSGSIPMLIADMKKCSTLGILEEQTVKTDPITGMGKMESTAYYFSAMDHKAYNLGKLHATDATKRYAQAAKIIYVS